MPTAPAKAKRLQHIKLRPLNWDVIEELVELVDCLSKAASAHELVALDDISLWLANLVALGMSLCCEVDRLIAKLCSLEHKLVVSKELSLGVQPNNVLVCKYVGLLGSVNQALASSANSVYFVIAGQPVKLK
ncbi:bifunctional adenosylcobinamide kinase/adenosylcobinamide-phosphate guanylyltransferase [Candidatus Hodgkinia cicadicola]